MSTQETKLKAIADAIRTKDGTTEPIIANDFPARILAIPTGGMPSDVRTITLTADPADFGTVSGGGMASEGMTITVAAVALDGNEFDEWQLGGVTVSENALYTFQVDSDVALTAVFAAMSVKDFAYTGDVAELTLPPGIYRLEVWGAEGGYRSNASYAGKGGYSVGSITITEPTTVFVRAGGSGNTGGASGGFNGGGKRGTYNGGGGASDIRIGVDDLYHRVIVAGGGGSDGAAIKAGGCGGGSAGQARTDNYGSGGYGGTQTGVSNFSWQTSDPSDNTSSTAGAYAGFGFGGNGISSGGGHGGAGGGGWYGGSGSVPDSSGDDDRGGGGGSGFVWTGMNAPSGFGLTEKHYLANAQTKNGAQTFMSPSGTTEAGHSGDGYVRITPSVTYIITVISENEEKGTVSGGGEYEGGASATVSAIPASGYAVSGWYDGETQVSTDRNYTFIVNGNRTLTARFEESQYESGVDWWEATLPSSEDWSSVTYGNGKFVAVSGGNSAVAYSTDGINWTAATLPSSAEWSSVTYGNGKFVAVSGITTNSSKAAYSTDGITWAVASLPSYAHWSSVTYGNGKFVAVSGFNTSSNKAAYSTDGINWTAATLPSSAYWYSVTYGDGKFVAVSGGNSAVAYSTDGINWTAATLPSSAYWYSVTYGDGKFVAVSGGNSAVAYSTDGINWTAATLPSSAEWSSVTYGNGKFVAVSGGNSAVAYSTDGITWAVSTLPSSAYWQSVTYGDGKFVAVVNNSNKAAYSSAQGPEK